MNTKKQIEEAFEARLRTWYEEFDKAVDKQAYIQKIKDDTEEFDVKLKAAQG